MSRSPLLLFFLFPVTPCLTGQQYAPGAGIQTHYQTFGDGPPLLLINGGPGFSSEGFAALAEQLSGQSRVITYDQRGTGGSALDRVDTTTITVDLMVADIEALREHLGYDIWTVMGHSFGGMLASYYAARHPGRIDGLILSSSGGLDLSLLDSGGVETRLSETERDTLRYWRSRRSDSDYADARFRAAMARAYVYHEEYAPVVAERLRQDDLRLNGMVWSDLRRIRYDVKPELRTFTPPVLILQGLDDIIDTEVARTASRTFPNDRLVLLEQCGHYGWLDRPARYFGAIESFLTDLRDPDRRTAQKAH